MMRLVAVFLLAVGWLAAPILASAGEITVEPIRLAQGTAKATVEGAVIRGERALYAIDALAGQRLTLGITAVEQNAAFQLYAPGAKPEQRDYGLEIVGEAMPGAAEGDDATGWSGVLPQTGSYLIVVGPTRGNASFVLTAELR